MEQAGAFPEIFCERGSEDEVINSQGESLRLLCHCVTRVHELEIDPIAIRPGEFVCLVIIDKAIGFGEVILVDDIAKFSRQTQQRRSG
jgi:hypothetical protein